MRYENILYMQDENNKCKIVYEDKVEVYGHTSLYCMKKLCLSYGHILKYAIKFSAKILKIRQKAPVLLSVDKTIIFFPVYGLTQDNIWIQYNKIKKLRQDQNGRCIIHFKNKETLVLGCNRRSIQRQRRRCRRLLQILKESIIE